MVLAGLTIVVVWLMLMEVVGVDDILKELPPVTSVAIMTMAAVPSATAVRRVGLRVELIICGPSCRGQDDQ